MQRAYYSATIAEFLNQDAESIFGQLASSHLFDLEQLQKRAWQQQIAILKKQLCGFSGKLYFEYSIPRMGKRVDVVAIIDSVVFVIEFKVGSETVSTADVDQVTDYALDLKNFHEESHTSAIAPMLVVTNLNQVHEQESNYSEDMLLDTQVVDSSMIGELISDILEFTTADKISVLDWEQGRYKPTPTIIEATLALYNQHSVDDITRRDANDVNLSKTSTAIEQIIEKSKSRNEKAIVFVTGVPGAGKTLVGLDIATKHIDSSSELYSVFLSGNGPLVAILQEALARDKVERDGGKIGEARSKVKAFIQNVHHFRDDCLEDISSAPVEHVALFDEAQRAWNLQQTSSFMKQKKGIDDFDQSEPQFLISCMNRHDDWAVVVCLIGGGQEINKGEAGIVGWMSAIENSFPNWKIYSSDQLFDTEYGGTSTIQRLRRFANNQFLPELHLKSSMRSFRSENVSLFVKQVLDLEIEAARETLENFSESYPIVLTRNIDSAQHWLRRKARGTERYGIVISSQAERLRPIGIHVRSKVNPVKWFLEPKDHVRSSYFMEEAATEFDVQGLELDWACVTWDADLRHSSEGWRHWSFRGNKWQKIRKLERQSYQINAYRVLLTRARQGMVICVPEGGRNDKTREPEYYDKTFNYLRNIGIQTI